MTPKIRHDKSSSSVVSTCSSCDFWRAFNWTLDQARESGANHLINVHDVPAKTARNTITKARERARHATDS